MKVDYSETRRLTNRKTQGDADIKKKIKIEREWNREIDKEGDREKQVVLVIDLEWTKRGGGRGKQTERVREKPTDMRGR